MTTLQDIINNNINNINSRERAANVISHNISHKDAPNNSLKAITTNDIYSTKTSKSITRFLNPIIRKQKIYSISNLKKAETFALSMDRMERFIGRPDESKLPILSAIVAIKSDLYTAINSIDKDDTSVKQLIQNFSSLASNINIIKNGAKQIIIENKDSVSKAVSNLNNNLSLLNRLNNDLNDSDGIDKMNILDKQEQILSKISQLIDVKYFRRNDQVVVMGGSWSTILDIPKNSLEEIKPFEYKNDKIYLYDKEITNIKGGTIGGFLSANLSVKENVLDKLNKLENFLLSDLNAINQKGSSWKGRKSIVGNNAITNNNIAAEGQLLISIKGDDGNEKFHSIQLNNLKNLEQIIYAIKSQLPDGMSAGLDPIGRLNFKSQNRFIIDIANASISVDNKKMSFAKFFGLKQLFIREDHKIKVNQEYIDNPHLISISQANTIAAQEKDNIINLMEAIDNFDSIGLEKVSHNIVANIAIQAKNTHTDVTVHENEFNAWKVLDASESGVDIATEQKKIQDIEVAISASMNIIRVITKLINEVISLR